MKLVYNKDQLKFPRLFVSYKYKAPSQQLLDSWKDKRMTGMRLSWRVENENPPLIASISEVGRSIQTPHLGETLDEASSDRSLGHVYKAILTPPKDLVQQMESQSLVIELDTVMNGSDEIKAYTGGYKLYKKPKSWSQAEAHCEREGGHLASIHSQWEQTLAKEAAEGNSVWLGGRKNGGRWMTQD